MTTTYTVHRTRDRRTLSVEHHEEIRENAAVPLDRSTRIWVADAKREIVSVTFQSGVTAVYRADDRIPLATFGAELGVSAIFGC
jgi:hypothetical protein